MRHLGVITKVTKSRNFLVKLDVRVDKDLKDMKVVLDDLTFIGVVSDIIGPVREPYALVKVAIPLDKASDLIGRKVYLIDRKEELKLIKYQDD